MGKKIKNLWKGSVREVNITTKWEIPWMQLKRGYLTPNCLLDPPVVHI